MKTKYIIVRFDHGREDLAALVGRFEGKETAYHEALEMQLKDRDSVYKVYEITTEV